ncbi:MFS transporter [Aquincola sp. S2]|uniref:MFS transporter n=1 Tax=Pseudaquabacterium terrae TaxID=2732868 RepID=A0ABX2EPW6_9BURK|nr:MFS transporter [Aquabacterium terrae]NRF70700.1 MFS transporter [Aquabacterium terrae]
MASSSIDPRPHLRPHPLGHHALVLLCVLAHTALTGARVAVSLQALALGAPALGFGLLLASFAIVPTLGSLAIGRWIDRIGTRRPLLLGLAAQVSGLAAAALAPQSLVGLGAAAVLGGGGYSMALLALQSQLGRRDEPQRSAAFASFGIGTSVSIGLGPFIAGHGLSSAGAAFTFALLGLLPLAAAVGAGFGRRHLHARRGSAASQRAAAAAGGAVLRDPALRRILIADLLMALGWNANGFLLPLYATQQGWSAATVGDLGAAFGLGVGLVRLGSAAWRRRVGDWTTIRTTLISAGGCFALLPLLPALTWALLLQFVLGVGLGIALPSVMALLHAQSPAERQAETLGLRIVMLNASYLAVPLLLGGLGAAAGVSMLLWSLGGSLSIGAVWFRR